MTFFHNTDIAKLIVRVTCGSLLWLHGLNKVVHGTEHLKEMIRGIGLPEHIAYGAYLGEFVAPVFMVIGYGSRLAGLIVAFNMLMSILIAYQDNIFALNKVGGWMIELNVLYLVMALAVFFAGAGKYSLSKGVGRWD